jgi:hypothetical protein
MSAPNDTWPRLIEELRDTVLTDVQTTCANEEEFRASFEELCEAQDLAAEAQRLLGQFMRQHVAPITFISAIDSAQSLTAPTTLSDLFWQTAFATIQVEPFALC